MRTKNTLRKKPLKNRITALFKKYIVKRPKGQCQILFSIYELDELIDKIFKEIFLDYKKGEI
ncbi:hypothetical protein ES695_05430 [Candidatus Atribacteria bacterium 1244-E10-H5-B2]|nr:MAG: hypothetical protein ES695_05430 [Candidatus Atribacteria bacterium 1244-E10-H5-B2]